VKSPHHPYRFLEVPSGRNRLSCSCFIYGGRPPFFIVVVCAEHSIFSLPPPSFCVSLPRRAVFNPPTFNSECTCGFDGFPLFSQFPFSCFCPFPPNVFCDPKPLHEVFFSRRSNLPRLSLLFVPFGSGTRVPLLVIARFASTFWCSFRVSHAWSACHPQGMAPFCWIFSNPVTLRPRRPQLALSPIYFRSFAPCPFFLAFGSPVSFEIQFGHCPQKREDSRDLFFPR